jgi:hypothetical protein
MKFFGSGNGGGGTGAAAKLPAVPLSPEGEAAMKKLMPKESSSKA